MRILDVGSGPTPKLASSYVEIDVVHCDIRPFPGVELQDMEKLTYPDDSFDIVICVNALDHTKYAQAGLEEMIRVAKNMVYIHCVDNQRSTSRKRHYWDARPDGTFTDGVYYFNLKDYGFSVEYIPNPGGAGEYGQVIGRLCLV